MGWLNLTMAGKRCVTHLLLTSHGQGDKQLRHAMDNTPMFIWIQKKSQIWANSKNKSTCSTGNTVTGTCFGMIPPLLLTIICGAWSLYFTRAGQDLARLPDGDVEHEAESIHQKWLRRNGTLGFQHNVRSTWKQTYIKKTAKSVRIIFHRIHGAAIYGNIM
jgi:hypothetical protein